MASDRKARGASAHIARQGSYSAVFGTRSRTRQGTQGTQPAVSRTLAPHTPCSFGPRRAQLPTQKATQPDTSPVFPRTAAKVVLTVRDGNGGKGCAPSR